MMKHGDFLKVDTVLGVVRAAPLWSVSLGALLDGPLCSLPDRHKVGRAHRSKVPRSGPEGDKSKHMCFVRNHPKCNEESASSHAQEDLSYPVAIAALVSSTEMTLPLSTKIVIFRPRSVPKSIKSDKKASETVRSDEKVSESVRIRPESSEDARLRCSTTDPEVMK